MKRSVIAVILVGLLSCNEDPSPPPADNTVHLAGALQNSNMDGDKTAGYWKDGTYTALTSGDTRSDVASLNVDGSSVVIGGQKWVPGSMSVSAFWNDGIGTDIEEGLGDAMVYSQDNNFFGVWLSTAAHGWIFNKNGTSQPIVDTAYSYWPMAMTVDEGNVYTAGSSSGKPKDMNDNPPHHAQYWKDGQLIFREDEYSAGLSIYIHNGDVYVGGAVYLPSDSTGYACYWKNGERVDLTDGTNAGIVWSMFVTDDHVFASGAIDDQAVYWKDGVATYLTTTGIRCTANSIFVNGEDVHVGGNHNGHPAYWKNDVEQTIDNQDKFGQINFVVVGSN
jgi:hypothetical protein